MYRQTDVRVDRYTDGQMDRWTDVQTEDSRAYRCTDIQMGGG